MKKHSGEFEIDTDGRRVPLHGPEAFAGMRRAGRAVAEVLDRITPEVRPGVSTLELDAIITAHIAELGARSATIGYKGYRHASCISVNHVVTHGIPDAAKRLQGGDILNIDVTVIVDGWHGDSSRMYVAGDAGVKARRLVDVTYDSMMAGIAAIRPGAHLGDVGHAIQTMAEAARFSVVRDFVGHGVGRVFHDAPDVHHVGRPGRGLILRPGMIFTVEPMLNAGRPELKVLADGWTAVTRDRSLSAQFEHSVGVTEDGVEIFTLSPRGLARPPYAAAG
ncbi:MAG: type I methionyl aminopeptidase [Inquilinus sp.]|uniref:type I methionyl aminopeptidase n=1 Tax=Inquilinus sp. TaxID=1932117 RepID=UPI003F300E6E